MVLDLTESSDTPWRPERLLAGAGRGDRAAGHAVRRARPAGTRPQRPRNARSAQPAPPIRVASKSVRVRGVLDAVLALPGYRGVLAFTLAEALWLARDPKAAGISDVVVGYPTTDRAAIATLAGDPELASRVTIMVDSLDQLDIVDAIAAPGKRETIRVCLELDASWDSRLLGHIGTWRSPVHSVAEARGARRADRRPTRVHPGRDDGLRRPDRRCGGPADGAAGARCDDALDAADLDPRAGRRDGRRPWRRCGEVADLEFVNGGGTGSLEITGAEPAVTEIAAGSGLFGPHLFDGYSRFTPGAGRGVRPDGGAQADARRWRRCSAAAGSPPGRPARTGCRSRCGRQGLRMVPREAAGEVQTPCTGPAPARCGSATGSGCATPRRGS